MWKNTTEELKTQLYPIFKIEFYNAGTSTGRDSC